MLLFYYCGPSKRDASVPGACSPAPDFRIPCGPQTEAQPASRMPLSANTSPVGGAGCAVSSCRPDVAMRSSVDPGATSGRQELTAHPAPPTGLVFADSGILEAG